MIILAVHSSSAQLGVAVVSDDVILSESILPPGREHLDNLALMIDDVIRRTGIRLKEVDGFGVALGPGSFSGIRIGLATIKGLALALKKPVAGIPSLEILAWQSLQEGESGAALIDARRNEIYLGLYKKSSGRLLSLSESLLIPSARLNEYLEKAPYPLILSGDSAIEPQIKSVSRTSRTMIIVPSPVGCAVLARQRLRQYEPEDLHSIAPIYIRRSDAEEKRGARNGK